MKVAVFGPPAVGKSTLLAKVGLLSSHGAIRPTKIVDSEALEWDPETNIVKDSAQLLSILSRQENDIVLGGGALNVTAVVAAGFLPLLLLPPLPEYKILYEEKRRTRGIGDDPWHRWSGALQTYKWYESQLEQQPWPVATSEEDALRQFMRYYSKR